MERTYEINYVFIYYSFINIALFLLMFIDKNKAIKNKWRIRENTLFLFFMLGGFLGGFLSMKLFKHKTKKKKFYFIGILSMIIHLFMFLIIFL